MYSSLLDAETLGAVIAAAPKIDHRPVAMVRRIVELLEICSTDLHLVNGCWSMPLKDLAERTGETAKWTGLMVRELGLEKKRWNDGYRVYWNREQLQILRKALWA
jgi:hypothetical protein